MTEPVAPGWLGFELGCHSDLGQRLIRLQDVFSDLGFGIAFLVSCAFHFCSCALYVLYQSCLAIALL
eukprot:4487003-Amphidinium_carterae.1